MKRKTTDQTAAPLSLSAKRPGEFGPARTRRGRGAAALPANRAD